MELHQRVLSIFNFLAYLLVAVQARRIGHGTLDPKVYDKNYVIRDTVETGEMVQPLDQFNPINTANWTQRYFYNFEYYDEDKRGPVFIMLGGEEPIDPYWVQSGFMMELCKQFHGAAFEPEHRYWGDSFPTNDLTIDSLKYLTVDQVLADFATFIQTIKTEYNLKENKIVVVGGSYPGQLAVYLGQKYPFLMDIVWASSATVLLKMYYPEYVEVTGNVIRDISQLCYDEIKGAFDELEALLWDCHYNVTRKSDETSDRNRPPHPQIPYCVKNVKHFMNETFTLCEPFNVYIEDDIRNFFQSVVQYFGYIIQYNSQLGNYSMENYCNRIFANTTLNLTRIQKVSLFVNDVDNDLFGGAYCLDYTEESYCSQNAYTGANSTAARQWLWLECYQIFLNPVTDSPNQPFGKSVTGQFLIRQCQCIFGERFDEVFMEAELENRKTTYGIIGATKYTTRMIITNGQNDPWSLGGIMYQNETSCSNLVLVTPGASHCYDLSRTKTSDTPEITKTREIIRHQIEDWLKEDLPCYT